VAQAIVHHLAHSIRCLSLFSTHYWILVDQHKNDKAVAQYHMVSSRSPSRAGRGDGPEGSNGIDAMVAADQCNICTLLHPCACAAVAAQESVVEGGDLIFTFQFVRGPGSKSFGLSVAHAAGLPDELLQRAKHMSAEFEAQCRGNQQRA